MIRGYGVSHGRLASVDAPFDAPDEVVWFDVKEPSADEQARLAAILGLDLPTREDMEEIEDSSRLYHENGVAFMTAILPARAGMEDMHMAPVTFILVQNRLITLRHHEPRAFTSFPAHAMRTAIGCVDAQTVFLSLLDAIIDRLADILEEAGRGVGRISHAVLRSPDTAPGERDYRPVLRDVGLQGELVSHVQASLVSLERLIAFTETSKEARGQLKILARDASLLAEHAAFLSQKIGFLLDATLGMIGMEQNATIKIFSVAAVVFLPPTLIASIYGMNFDVMPELHWALGYPLALALMVGSAFLSYWIFKKRGWL